LGEGEGALFKFFRTGKEKGKRKEEGKRKEKGIGQKIFWTFAGLCRALQA